MPKEKIAKVVDASPAVEPAPVKLKKFHVLQVGGANTHGKLNEQGVPVIVTEEMIQVPTLMQELVDKMDSFGYEPKEKFVIGRIGTWIWMRTTSEDDEF